MKNRSVLTACLILTWLTLSTTPVMCETQESESEMMPRSECEEILTEQWIGFEEELTELGREHEADMRKRSAECEERVRQAAAEGTEAGAAEAARPLLVEIAGVEAEAKYWKDRVFPWAVGCGVVGIVIGLIVGLLAG